MPTSGHNLRSSALCQGPGQNTCLGVIRWCPLGPFKFHRRRSLVFQAGAASSEAEWSPWQHCGCPRGPRQARAPVEDRQLLGSSRIVGNAVSEKWLWGDEKPLWERLGAGWCSRSRRKFYWGEGFKTSESALWRLHSPRPGASLLVEALMLSPVPLSAPHKGAA